MKMRLARAAGSAASPRLAPPAQFINPSKHRNVEGVAAGLTRAADELWRPESLCRCDRCNKTTPGPNLNLVVDESICDDCCARLGQVAVKK